MFSRDPKRASSKPKQTNGISGSVKRDETDSKLPDINQNAMRSTGFSQKMTPNRNQDNNRNVVKRIESQPNQIPAPKPSSNYNYGKKPVVGQTPIQTSKRVNSIQQSDDFQEEAKEQQIIKQVNKPPAKDFLAINKAVAASKKSAPVSNLQQKSRLKSGNDPSTNQKPEKEELEGIVQINNVVKPREFKFLTNARVEHRKEMNMLKAKENIILDRVNYHIQRIILCFAASSYQDVYRLMKVCKKFYSVITTHYRIWECVLTSLTKVQQIEFLKKYPSFDEMQDNQKIKIIREYVEVEEKKNVIKSYDKFFADYRKLFEYCSTKENLPNKLLQRLKLQASATINKIRIPEKKYLLRSENFSSHLLIKFEEISKINLQYLDDITFEISFFSVHLKTSVKITRKFKVRNMFERSVVQKAFCYYEERNFLTCFFEGDQMFLYTLFEISAMELVTRFRFELEKRLIYEEKQKLGVKTSKLQSKYLQRDMSQYQYDSFTQYFNYQSDFEVMINVHNSLKKNLYTFIDTRSFPKYQTENEAQFIFAPQDRFFIENIFSLDNKAGMKETVRDLILMDLVLKDRDRFLICFSGYVRIEDISDLSHKNNVDMNFDYSAADDYQAKRIYFQQPNLFSFELLIIQTKREAILKNINITIQSQIISGNLP